MKPKTETLIDKALDYAVAKSEGGTDFASDGIVLGFRLNGQIKVLAKGWATSMSFCPSTDWAKGGPIIEREKIDVFYTATHELGFKAVICPDRISNGDFYYQQYGPTALIAAMRCYVASKLGDEVDIPKELL